MLEKSVKTRLELIDSIRGITLISMILYHFVWDMVYLYGHQWAWFDSAQIWQQSICCTFIILAGYSFCLGRHHLKRGLMAFGGGVIVTLVSLFLNENSLILFGILTLLGSVMLIMTVLERLLKKIPALLGGAVCLLLFLFTKNCSYGYIGFFGLEITLPKFLYSNLFTAFWGFPPDNFYSADYFSIFPWIFLFVFGYFLYRTLEKWDLNKKLFSKGKIPVIAFLGKHSLLVYLVHQPIIYGLCEIFKFVL